MRIEHVAVYVQDLEQAKEFFCKYFGCTCNDLYHNKAKGFKSYFLSFDTGAILEIMQKEDVNLLIDNDEHLGLVHLAISVGSKEKVDTLTNTLRNDGYVVKSEPRTTGDGYYESVVRVLSNILIEITI